MVRVMRMNRNACLAAAVLFLLAATCLARPPVRTRREVVMSVNDDNYEQQLSVLGDGVGFYHDGAWDSGLAERLSVYRDLVYAVNCSTDPDLCFDNKVKKADRPVILVHKNRKVIARRSVTDETSNELFDWAADLLVGKIIQANPDHDIADEKALKEGYALVEYYAYWCGHCKAFSPVLRELSFLMEDSDVKIMRVECSDNNNYCAEEGIEGYPTINLTLDGEVVLPYIGDRTSAKEIQEWIDRSIAAYESGL